MQKSINELMQRPGDNKRAIHLIELIETDLHKHMVISKGLAHLKNLYREVGEHNKADRIEDQLNGSGEIFNDLYGRIRAFMDIYDISESEIRKKKISDSDMKYYLPTRY